MRVILPPCKQLAASISSLIDLILLLLREGSQSVPTSQLVRLSGEILTMGAIPVVDTWTFTAAGEPWVDQQWGAQIVLALAERMGSWTGLVLFRAVLAAVIFGSLLTIARRRGLTPRDRCPAR